MFEDPCHGDRPRLFLHGPTLGSFQLATAAQLAHAYSVAQLQAAAQQNFVQFGNGAAGIGTNLDVIA